MKKNQIPSIDFLNECFQIVDGALFWKTRPASHFNSERSKNMWNAKFAGKKAGRTMADGSYRQVGISGVRYLEHRILAAMYGIDVNGVIDHIDGNGINNSRENLRSASQQENSMNNAGWSGKRLRVGVYKKGNKFMAGIRIGGTQKYLGTFDTESEAVAARKGAENLFYAEFAITDDRVLAKR